MESTLILYVDADYLIPVVRTADGDLFKYTLAGDCRMWLYFFDNPHKDGVDWSYTCKAHFEKGEPGYWGDFWHHVGAGIPFESRCGSLGYAELLQHSGMLKSLTDFFAASTGSQTPTVPVRLVFSDQIALPARKQFLYYLQEHHFRIDSYSVSIHELLVSYLLRTRQQLQPQFGEKILFLHASGPDLLLSYCIYDGEQFLEGEAPQPIANQGSNPLKRALVKYVVDKVDNENSFLTADSREREYHFQMQYVDEWLALRTNAPSFIIDDFHYSSDAEITYRCVVDTSILRSVQENSIRDLVVRIQTYQERVIHNDLLQVIMVGDAFEDALFKEKIVATLADSRRVLYCSVSAIQEVLNELSTYDRQEKLERFDTLYLEKAQASSSIQSWVRHSEQIRALRDEAVLLKKQFDQSMQQFRHEFGRVEEQWNQALRHSNFQKARDTLSQIKPAALHQLRERAASLSATSDSQALLYSEISSFEGAKHVINSITHQLQGMHALCDECQHFEQQLTNHLQETHFLEDNYSLYREKLRQFNAERSLTQRKKMAQEMAKITREELPATQAVNYEVRLDAEVVKEGSFFRKKQLLKITIGTQEPLPCDCVLLVSPTVLVQVDRTKAYTCDFEKGTQPAQTVEVPLPLPVNPKAQSLYVYFWPHESSFVSINDFQENKCQIKL